jgi:RNA polymerase sigma-70 factor (ECF subfamily)
MGELTQRRDAEDEGASATLIRFPVVPRDAAITPDHPLARAARDHGGELYGWLRRRLRDSDAAEDARQEVYLRLARQGPLGRIANLRAYIFQTARSVLVDAGRSRRARGEPAVLDPQGHRDPSPDAEQSLLSSERWARMQTAVAALPTFQRQALIWARYDGLTLKEIGRRLSVSESMACRYVNDALKACQEAIEWSSGSE